MQVGEISERTGVSVRAIRDLLETGFTLADVTALAPCLLSAADGAAPGSDCGTRTAAMYREKLAKIDAQMRTLGQLRQRIEERLAEIRPSSSNPSDISTN